MEEYLKTEINDILKKKVKSEWQKPELLCLDILESRGNKTRTRPSEGSRARRGSTVFYSPS